MFIRELCQNLSIDIKNVFLPQQQGKYQQTVQKVEKFIEREGSTLHLYSPIYTVDLLFLENYCCHKIIHKLLLGTREHVDTELLGKLLDMLLRNVSLFFQIFEDFIEENQILFSVQTKSGDSLLGSELGNTSIHFRKPSGPQVSEKHFSRFIESILMLSKNYALFFQYKNESLLKHDLLQKSILFIETIESYQQSFFPKSHNQKLLQCQIFALYGVALYGRLNYRTSAQILEKAINRLIFNISDLEKKLRHEMNKEDVKPKSNRNILKPKLKDQNAVERSRDKKKRTKIRKQKERKSMFLQNSIKKCYNILFLTLLHLTLCYSLLNSHHTIQYLFTLLTKMQNLPYPRKIIKNYALYYPLRLYLIQSIQIHEDFSQMLHQKIYPDSTLANLIESFKNSKQSLIQTQVKRTQTSKDTINKESLRENGLGIIYKVYDQLIENGNCNNFVNKMSRDIIKMKKPKLISELDREFNKELFHSIDLFNKKDSIHFSATQRNQRVGRRDFSASLLETARHAQTFRRTKKNSSLFAGKQNNQQTLKKAKIELKKKGRNFDQKKNLHQAFAESALSDAKLFQNQCLNQLAAERQYPNGEARAPWQSLYSPENLQMAEGNLYKKSKLAAKSRHKGTKSNSSYDNMSNRQNETTHSLARRTQIHNNPSSSKVIEKFFNLLIKNKNRLGLSEYCSRMEAHLKKQVARRKALIRCSQENIKIQRGTYNKLMRCTSPVGVFGNNTTKETAKKTSILLQKFQSLNLAKGRRQQRQKKDSLTEDSVIDEQEPYNNISEDTVPRDDLDRQRELCYRKSYETITELVKKLQKKDVKSKKLVRRSQLFFQDLDADNS